MLHHVSVWQRKRVFLAAFLLIPVLIFIIGVSGETAEESEVVRVDILDIELPGDDQPNEMPAVLFLHDRHTRALEKKGCDACHPKDPEKAGEFIFEFKQAADLEYKAGMALYHEECVGCHTQRADASKTTGPLVEDCRGCHREKPGVESAQKMINFDKSLHFRHVSAEPISFEPSEDDKNCGACHHVYDEKTDKLVYEKGTEGTCRYCHGQKRQDDTRTFRNAVHTDCVNCHRKLKTDDVKTGPV